MEEANDSSGKNTIKQMKSVEISDLDEENSKESLLTCGSRLCLIGAASLDPEVVKSAETFTLEVVISEDGSEWNDLSTVFVLADFEGPVYECLQKLKVRLLGTMALRELSARKEPLPPRSRPLYSLAMWGLIICFTGFRKKEELERLIKLIHNMGGHIRRDTGSDVTHVVAKRSGGKKYQYAMTFRVPVVSSSWVYEAWAMRSQLDYSAADSTVIANHKLKPFQGARMCFVGFPDDEQKHMMEVLCQNGGTHTDHEDPECTHMVVDESTISSVPTQAPQAYIVKAEWFWASVQNESCANELDYLFEDYLEKALSPGAGTARSTPITPSTRARKRKRLQEVVGLIASGTVISPATNKRRSSVSDAGLLSVSGSFLDCTNSPATNIDGEPSLSGSPHSVSLKDLSPRHQVFLELVQTEGNFVNILKTIMTLYQHPLEKMVGKEDQLLNLTQINHIFGNLQPIYETHTKLLEDLRIVANNWTEDVGIGNIIQMFAEDAVKSYGPYVNYYESSIEMLNECDETMPRFHAFLKIGQGKAESGRQSLGDLFVRPIQRLPQLIMLLTDIQKRTPTNNADYRSVEAAANKLKDVTKHINEDKRKTEGQMFLFEIFNEIEKCPADILSSHRNFITRCDVLELSEGLSKRGDHLTFFLFSDNLEVCKKKSKAFNSLKSPNTSKLNSSSKQIAVPKLNPTKVNTMKANSGCKSYKHVQLIPLSNIKMVFDVTEAEECHNLFALMCKSNQDLKEKVYSFSISDETEKTTFLKTLCRQVANTVCRPDAENFLEILDAEQLNIDTSEIGMGTLSKAFKFASRTRMKVGRAFSFNKTPSKLKRAMSTMMSPFGSTSNLTPSSQLAQMRLASCNNLNELGTATPPAPQQYTAPMSVQPTRRNKHSSLSVASLRRL